MEYGTEVLDHAMDGSGVQLHPALGVLDVEDGGQHLVDGPLFQRRKAHGPEPLGQDLHHVVFGLSGFEKCPLGLGEVAWDMLDLLACCGQLEVGALVRLALFDGSLDVLLHVLGQFHLFYFL